jgi:Mycothiol maleylpyruvate isomerase N-terminal domain
VEEHVPSKQELIDGIRTQGQRAEEIAGGLSEQDWTKGVHEAGWNVKQAYSHLASTAAGVGFIVMLSQQPPSGGGGGSGSFDINDFNKEQVALRESKSTDELVAELKTGIAQSLQALEGLDQAAIDKETRSIATGEIEPVGNVLQMTMVDHYKGHLDEIESKISS